MIKGAWVLMAECDYVWMAPVRVGGHYATRTVPAQRVGLVTAGLRELSRGSQTPVPGKGRVGALGKMHSPVDGIFQVVSLD